MLTMSCYISNTLTQISYFLPHIKRKTNSHLDLGQVVDWLLTHGADPQLADRAGDTALHYAVLGARWVASQSEASCWSRDLSSDQ